jgi:lysophospholipase L1-like esterase
VDLRHYVALGDSVSMDLFPALDAGETDVAVALERASSAGRVAALGAASLLHRNDETYWPEEMGNDLATQHPGITYTNLAADGASIGDVFGEQLAQIDTTDEPTLVTLTVGTTDLLSAFANRPKPGLTERIAHDVLEAFDFLVTSVRQARPTSLLIVSTIYDPSDGTGRAPGVFDGKQALPLDALETFNAGVRSLASGTTRVLLADLHARFLGHGVTAPAEDRWYWRRSILEPSARGASEIRHLWIDALMEAGVVGQAEER